MLFSYYKVVVPAPHQQHLFQGNQWNFFSQATWAVQTAEHIRLPASLTGLPAAFLSDPERRQLLSSDVQ